MTMTLRDFKNHLFSFAPQPPTIYVFQNMDHAKNWIEDTYHGGKTGAYTVTLTINSDHSLEYSLKDEWCKAPVRGFYAVAPDVVVAIVKGPHTTDLDDDEDIDV